MTEHQDSTDAGEVRTGVESVDAVIVAVGDLGQRPVEEHVAVFEHAHEQLRGALDARASEPGPSGQLQA